MRSRVIPWHFTAVLMMLSACSDGASVSQADQSQAYATILEALPYAPVTQLEPEPYSPTLQDRRWRFADKLEEQHLPMLRRLKRGEIGNFGGIEWRWRDGPENDGLGTITGVAPPLPASLAPTKTASLANGLTVSVTGSHRPGSATSVCRG